MDCLKDYDYVPIRDSKYCFVPTCKNSSGKHPSKLFFCVPNSAKEQWCGAVNILHCPKRTLFVCEDHLNLEQDIDNYFQWKLGNFNARLKKEVPQKLLASAASMTLGEGDDKADRARKKLEATLPQACFEIPVVKICGKAHSCIEEKGVPAQSWPGTKHGEINTDKSTQI